LSTVIERIVNWANQLEYWEKAILTKLLSNEKIEEEDYKRIVEFFLQDKALAAANPNRKPINLLCDNTGERETKQKNVLREMYNLENVNALISNQHLSFGNQLTVVFGRNGAGKSGYARVLGSAGFTRGDSKVLPDVSKPVTETTIKKAKIKYEIEGVENEIDHKIGAPCIPLSSFYVFDSTSVMVHMAGKNAFSFSPAGLSILTELAAATDVVRGLVREKIAVYEKTSDFEKYFPETSDIKDLVVNITSETNYQKLEKIANISDETEKRLHELDLDIGKIGLGKFQADLEQKRRDKATVLELNSWINNALGRVNHSKLKDLNQLISEYNELVIRAKTLSIQSFTHEGLSQTGSTEWLIFLKSAKNLGKTESTDVKQYPVIGDPCLFCHQPLSKISVEHIRKIWDFLDESIQVNINRIKDELETFKSGIIEAQKYPLSEDYKTALALIKIQKEELSGKIQNQVQQYSEIDTKIIEGLITFSLISTEWKDPVDSTKEVTEFSFTLEKQISEMESINIQEKYSALVIERILLLHKKLLNSLLPQIKTHIENCKWAQQARQSIGSTRQITQMHNTLFDELVKNEYVRIFSEILTFLQRPLAVEIMTSGQKGESVKQIQLKVDKSAAAIASPEKVLSEGEKRAIALADFITEAKLDIYSNGLILDDPVTSLDLEWRERISQLLAKEAKERQVIIFTHDLPFIYYLINESEKQTVDIKTHTIKRGGAENKPGYVVLDYCPSPEKSFTTADPARKMYTKAIKTEGEDQYNFVELGFDKLRASYECIIIYDLFGGVVRRFDEQIRVGTLTSLVWDENITKEISDSHGRISRYIGAHSHSDEFSKELTPNNLLNEIQIFESVKAKIKALKTKKQPN
jgi:ABC-type Mn2+/Zn2+ transport system ATPase subunit